MTTDRQEHTQTDPCMDTHAQGINVRMPISLLLRMLTPRGRVFRDTQGGSITGSQLFMTISFH